MTFWIIVVAAIFEQVRQQSEVDRVGHVALHGLLSSPLEFQLRVAISYLSMSPPNVIP